MKKTLILILGVILMNSCEKYENETVENNQKTDLLEEKDSNAFLHFSSKEELNNAINSINSGSNNAATRASIVSADLSTKKVNSEFISLIEANKKQTLEKLSQAQRDSIINDEDDLEFCLADSIVADYAFSQLLNAAREIQVGDTVYRYFANGVACTDYNNSSSLMDIDKDVQKIKLNEANIGKRIQINENIKFTPIPYSPEQLQEKNTYTRGGIIGGEPIYLKNGIIIPANDIRDVDYESNGDGGWLHRAWSRIWGRNVLAIKKYNRHKRLRLGLYDQNYIIYANIGATVKMQKKVCGIWWNCKADEIRLCWSVIGLKYKFEQPVIKYFNQQNYNSSLSISDYPLWMEHNFPFKNENSTLFYIPFTSYKVKIKNVNKAIKSGINELLQKGLNIAKNKINGTPEDYRGLYSNEGCSMFLLTGGDENVTYRSRTLTKKFYAEWFPGNYEVGFSYDGKIKPTSIKFDKGVETKLDCGIVYAAVKFRGKWLAARITKNGD